MMDSYKSYRFWLESDYFDGETKEELKSIEGNKKEIEERFYKDLEFGTGGLRGIIAAGTNRIKKYTIRKASQGLANYISKKGQDCKQRGIVIAYDSRHRSYEFALESAKVFAGNGIKAYLFDELRPTPVLSFAVRFLKAAGGVVITASHNPKEYNGYKVYGEDGAQISIKDSDAVYNEISKINDITRVDLMDKETAIKEGLIKIIGSEIDDEYIERLKSLVINRDLIKNVSDTLKIVYTPLHGTGNKPVQRILKEVGLNNVIVVKEQELPDPDFSTVKYPNPEDKDSFSLAIDLARKHNVDMIIGTDPDCDRVGVIVKNSNDEYVTLTGNQTGCLLMEYILSQKKKKGELPDNGFVAATIVSTNLAREIAREYNVQFVEVLTGFKFIGEKIREMDEYGDKKFLFGFEESYGYLAGTFSRDKDGVVASMLIAEMAAYYKSRGMSLYEGLQELFAKYGYYMEDVTSFAVEGKEGLEKISHTMQELRRRRPSSFNGEEVYAIRDYSAGKRLVIAEGTEEHINLPKSDVLYYEMKDGSWFCVRPSGTEPKIKIYYGVCGTDNLQAEKKLKTIKETVLGYINKLLS